MAIKPRTAPTAAKPGLKPAAKPTVAVAEEGAHGIASTVTVFKTYKDGATITAADERTETLETPRFEGPVATVSVNVAHTKNLGNYESVKVGILVSLPCYVAELEEAYATASKVAGEFLDRERETVSESIPENGEAATEEAVEEVGEADAAEAEGAEQSDEDYVNSLDREGLEGLIDENSEGWETAGADVPDYSDAKAFPKNPKGLKALKAAVLSALETAAAAEEAGEETAEAGAEEPQVGYTQEELEGADEADLKAIFADWDLGEFPKGPPAKRKEKAVAMIMEAQGG